MKQSSSKHKIKLLHHYIEAPKQIQKKYAYTHPYTPRSEHQTTTSNGIMPFEAPPKKESKKSANPKPYTWSKNPYELRKKPLLLSIILVGL